MKTNFYLTDRTERRELDIDKFIDTVCLEFGAEKDKVLSIDRKSELVIVRKVLIFFIQNCLPKITSNFQRKKSEKLSFMDSSRVQ